MSRKKNKKEVKRNINPPESSKKRNFKPPPNHNHESNHLHPIFCFGFIKKKYNIAVLQKEEKVSLIDTIHNYSQKRWITIEHSHKHKGGIERIDMKYVSIAPPNFVTPDQNKFDILRFYGKCPMIGVKQGFIFHVLALDRNHELYSAS